MGHKARIYPAGQATTECLGRTVQQDRALRMAVPISLGRSGPRTARRHAVDVVLQSRAAKYGSGRIYPETAVSHGRVALLLLPIAKNGGITIHLDARGNPNPSENERSLSQYIELASSDARDKGILNVPIGKSDITRKSTFFRINKQSKKFCEHFSILRPNTGENFL